MVFQSYALYPHMTVEENMGFGLKMTGHPEVRSRAGSGAPPILHLEPLLHAKAQSSSLAASASASPSAGPLSASPKSSCSTSPVQS
jgi:ABC-type sugar transport system ATPase subunit